MAGQNYKNHTRLDPAFHLTLIPVLWFVLISAIVVWWHAHTFVRGLAVLGAIGLLWTAFLARIYALKNQNRIIRLEERLRLASLGVPAETLTTRQLIALRFASDGEVPALTERARREALSPKQIKQSVQQWRADEERV